MKKFISFLLFAIVVLAVVLWAAGVFRTGQVAPGHEAPPREKVRPGDQFAPVVKSPLPVTEVATGTVRSRHSVRVAARIPGRIEEIRKRAGEKVKMGEVLVVIDDRDLQARLAQAGDALTSAKAAAAAAREQMTQSEARRILATKRYHRIQGFYEKKAATLEALEIAEAEFLEAKAAVAAASAAVASADAQVARAKEVVREAQVALGYARIVSPIAGVVSEKQAEVGDLAFPGRTILVIHDPMKLRLEARVRESLASALEVGASLTIQLSSLGKELPGTLDRVLPSADPLSRTFEARVNFDPIPGAHPGMFGRLEIPVGERTAIRVPSKAVKRVGQVESVLVRHGEDLEVRLVTSGRTFDDGSVEILSGLSGGEEVLLRRGEPR